MSQREHIIQYLKRRAEELRRELEIIEYLLRILESNPFPLNPGTNSLTIIKDLDGIKISLPRPLSLDSVEGEYLISRLDELIGNKYVLLKDQNRRLRGIFLKGRIDEKMLIEIRSVLKTIL